jgi:hypothetical protein
MIWTPHYEPPSADCTALPVIFAAMVVLMLYGITPAVMPSRSPQRTGR